MAESETIQTISRISGPIQNWGLYRKSLLFAELSRIAYLHEKEAGAGARQIGFPHVEFFDVDGAQAYLFSNEHDLVLACRGTEPREWNDVKADMNAWPVIAETIGRVHRGFKKEADDLWPVLEQRLVENTKELWLCGHSLGGAMATIYASRCKLSYIKTDPVELYTYGSPRVGTKKYVTFCTVKHVRWVNNNDLVPRVPPGWLGYYHVGDEVYLNAYGKVRKHTPYQRLKDRYRGFAMGLRMGKLDHFSDHVLTRYIEYIYEVLLESGELPSPF